MALKPLTEEAAFNKGVDYLVELVFFYGVIMVVGFYELKKGHEASIAMKNLINDTRTKTISNQTEIDKLKELSTRATMIAEH